MLTDGHVKTAKSFCTLKMSFKFASVNVRRVRDGLRCASTLSSLANVKADLLFLQECGIPHLTSYRRWSRVWSHGPSIWSGGNDCRSSGLGILLRGGSFTISEVREVVGGRLLIADVTYRNCPLRLINVYAPAVKTERLAVLEQLPQLLTTSRPVILGGDFSCITDKAD